ncbi:MAG: alpha/beta hydrolase [Pseudomonadota bacterium]
MSRTLPLALIALLATPAALAETQRHDFSIETDAGTTLALREVTDSGAPKRGDPVILLHGARVPALASFDLPVPGGSLAADLAAAGLTVYLLDLTGYGGSTRPAAMAEPRVPSEPLVRSGQAAQDLQAAVRAVKARSGADQVALLGWATGAHWAGLYATLAPDEVSRVVFYNSLYGYTPDHPVLGPGTRLASPEDPERFDRARFQNYRLNTAASLLPGWDRSIPIEDKGAWRDPAVAEAYVAAALASDPTAKDREPPSFRAPSGAMADSFLLASGAALWDARMMTADALVLRSSGDFWSRPEDAALLTQHLASRTEGEVQTVTLPDATHFVHLDRPESGRNAFLEAVVPFLTDPAD